MKHSDPILNAFDALVRRTSSKSLVVSGSLRTTVGEIDALARALERDRLGSVAAGSLVALTAPNGPSFLVSLLALRRRRAAALLLAPNTPVDEHRSIASLLGCSASLEAKRGWPDGVADFRVEGCRSVDSSAAEDSDAYVGEDVAVLKLTSGSTGTPRGIVTPSAALVADDEGLSRSMGLVADDRILAAIPMSHSYGLSSVVLPALMRGSTLVLPKSQAPFAPLEAADDHGATFFPTTPSYLGALVRKSEPPPLAETVRLVITAGAPLCPEVAQAFRRMTGRAVHGFYGASECGGICFDREGDAGEKGLVGEPVEGVRIELRPPMSIANPDEDSTSVPITNGEPSTAGGCGQVIVRSPAVARGFLGVDGEPAGGAADRDLGLWDGAFVSSDLATFEGSRLRLIGRADDLINVRGKKVNPREVERVLSQLSGVDEAVVIGAPRRNQPGLLLRAVLACTNGAPSYEQVIVWCRPRLAAHKVPRSIVVVDRIPRTERGKIDRRALQSLIEAKAS